MIIFISFHFLLLQSRKQQNYSSLNSFLIKRNRVVDFANKIVDDNSNAIIHLHSIS